MWNEVGQALSQSMTKMLSQMAGLLPGILALITALLVSVLIAWAFSAIIRRSLAGIDFDVDLIHQFVKLGVVPERVVLRPIGAIPGVEVIGRVKQG